MNNYREIWDESHYKFGVAKDLKHVSWENYKKIKKAEAKGGFLRVIGEVVAIAFAIMGFFCIVSLFSMV